MRLALLTLIVLIAFAGNSVIARLALNGGNIGPWGFSLIRFASGALMLLILSKPKLSWPAGRWTAAIALCGYGVFFSFAYLKLATGTGALAKISELSQQIFVGGGGGGVSASWTTGAWL